MITFSYYGFFSWIPTLLVQRGITVTKSFEFSIIIYLAQVPGYFSAAWLSEKLDRKNTIAIYLTGSAVSAFWLSQMDSPATITLAGAVLSFFLNGTYAGVYSYTPEVFPTWIRASGTGLSSAFGRVGSILAPTIIGLSAASLGFAGVFGLTTAVLVAGGALRSRVRPGHGRAIAGRAHRTRQGGDQVIELEERVRAELGVRLFTVLAWVPERRALRRVHSSHPEQYPVGGEKSVEVAQGWLATCVERREPYFGADREAVRAVFADHALIESLGCGAVINVPVVDGDEVLGVLNMLDAEGAYDERSVAESLAPLAVPALRGGVR